MSARETDSSATMWDNDAAAHHLGARLLAVDAGSALLELTIGPQHLNGLGVGHGGVLFTLADIAMSYGSNAGLGPGQQAVAAGATIDFLTPAPLDSVVRAQSIVEASVGRTTLHQVTIERTDLDEPSVVAVFHGRTRLVRH